MYNSKKGNPKDFTKKLLELINDFSKVAGYKINIQISVAFLYANNKLTRRFFKSPMYFKTVTKDVKNLYFENHKKIKKLKKIQISGNTYSVHG